MVQRIGDRKPNAESIIKGNRTLYYKADDNLLDVSQEVVDYYSGPYEFNLSVLDYGSYFRDSLESTVPKKSRIYNSRNGVLSVLGFTDSEILSSFEEVTRIANESLVEVRAKGLDYVYMRQLANVCARLDEIILDNSYDLVVVPLRGGKVVATMIPIENAKILAIDCKRLPLKRVRGDFAFGMNIPDSQHDNFKRFFGKTSTLTGKKVRILEVALASGMTSIGIMNELYQRGILPAHIDIVTPALAQKGYENVIEFAKTVGFSVSVSTAAMFYRLGDFYADNNDSILTDDGHYVIGDATKILEPFIEYE
ncbi:MAG: hypothetical protein UY18_C0003G0021 [Microgenomates group bacterium GW2011_GWF2_47_9]|nr:MAG: hypothetical protein UY18_C0003G0021 [Microgenomates group bacterium GW2011_GWF2_47_9]